MRPEKVQDKEGKAKVRKGTQKANTCHDSMESSEIMPYINRIICGTHRPF
jgi:hypothetical protein